MNKISAAKEVAFIAIICALLIGGQLALSAISGVEIVTVLLLCFSFCFGARCGVLCAVAFSLLRCFVFGFYPTVLILYLIYYPLFALCFGLLGILKDEAFKKFWILGIFIFFLGVLCVLLNAYDVIKISKIYKTTVEVFLWILAGLFFALFILLTFVKNKKLVAVCALAAIFTICFTLLDDVITPLFWGYSKGAALTYFYASFLAMLPQAVCAIVTVFLLFNPLNRLFLIALNNK